MIGTRDVSAVKDVGSRVQGNIQTQGESTMCTEQVITSEDTRSINDVNNRKKHSN